MIERSGEYLERGDYHRRLDRKWRYYPIYVEKMRLLEQYLARFPREKTIVDLGCGEGVLVERLRARGYDIRGIDLHYESECVERGDITATGLAAGSVDLVLCLDVIEHLGFAEQELAVREIRRILKPGGTLVATIPNLAHLSSRLAFLFTGNLLRTSAIERHPGDRPVNEYKRLFRRHFELRRVRGIFPTFPLSSLLTLAFPAGMLWWHRILNRCCPYPNWCFLNVYFCEKPAGVGAQAGPQGAPQPPVAERVENPGEPRPLTFAE
jgi:SAM-dependent methyltransferase